MVKRLFYQNESGSFFRFKKECCSDAIFKFSISASAAQPIAESERQRAKRG
jgi:hypothetical protein